MLASKRSHCTVNPLATLALAQTEAELHDMLQAFYVENEPDPDGDGVAGLPEDDLNALMAKYFADQARLNDLYVQKYGAGFLAAVPDSAYDEEAGASAGVGSTAQSELVAALALNKAHTAEIAALKAKVE